MFLTFYCSAFFLPNEEWDTDRGDGFLSRTRVEIEDGKEEATQAEQLPDKGWVLLCCSQKTTPVLLFISDIQVNFPDFIMLNIFIILLHSSLETAAAKLWKSALVSVSASAQWLYMKDQMWSQNILIALWWPASV